jgi:outer membrane receptor protein involved in Fe transport
MKNNRVLAATALATVLLFSASTTAIAQASNAEPPVAAPAEDEAKDPGELIVVTGSRIPRPQYEGTIPGGSVTAQQIEARAFTNTIDVLNDIPLVGPGANNLGTNGGQPSSLGVSFVDLLDLGTQRTLTLVNGRRFVSGNAGSLFVQGNTTGGQVDINSIPTALVARIDTLTVGGAVAYGSDAIAGVVNTILKDDFEGTQVSGLSSISSKGDAFTYRITGITGLNFAKGRGNIVASFESNHEDGVQGDQRSQIRFSATAPTFFGNGGRRNTAFAASLGINVALNNDGAFLRAADDGVPNNPIFPPGFSGGSILISLPGAIFQAPTANNTTALNQIATLAGTATNARPAPFLTQAGNVQLVPGVPIASGVAGCSTALATFCRFAPSSLPGTAAQQTAFANSVITRFAPNLSGQGTAAQQTTLAINLLQANLPTPREFLAQNPNTDINAFIGTFIPNFLDVANPNAATAPFLPRVAVPIQFDNAGNVVQVTAARITATTPSTTGGAVGGDFFNTAPFTVLRVEQDRDIFNFIGHYDIADSFRLYTENQYSRVTSVSKRNLASSNTITSGTTENAALILNINNPFLDAADRAALTAAGVTNNFILSRQNQDIDADNPAKAKSDTYRTVVGAKGDFNLLDRKFDFDASFTYGRADLFGERFQIKDIEYALAVDAVVNPANGQIVCRSQLTGSTALPPGVVAQELVRTPGPDGVIVERLVNRTVTQAQINACVPFNPFGFGQQSQAARDYVRADTTLDNKQQQYFGQVSLGGSFFDLPAGPLGFSVVGEYRRESLSFKVDDISLNGGTRTAALANTKGFTEAFEFGGEIRIPIFGQDFNLPLLRNVEINPGVRFVRQTGGAPSVRLLNGSLLEQKQKGDTNTIYSIAGSWRPIKDISFRANLTRSIKQPSIVELFLGGQPAFSGVADPCSTANIGAGIRPATRRANCEASVIAAGLAADRSSAAAFLNNFVPSGTGINGTFAGSPGLKPERGKSFTVGTVITPRFVPKLNFSADYINVKVLNQIIPTGIGTALQVCLDSPTFPNTSAEVGVDVCSFFSRRNSTAPDRQFEVDNGFNSGFINLGALQVKAINFSGDYEFELDSIFGGSGAGKISLFGNAYYLIDYLDAPDGNLGNAQQTKGSFGRPEWEMQFRARYENAGFNTQVTVNRQGRTKLLNAGVPATIEVQDVLRFPAFVRTDATIGYSFGSDQQYGFQLTARNLFDKQYAGPFAVGNVVDLIGRRFTLTGRVKF